MMNLILDDAKSRMNKALESFKGQLDTVRSGRANPNLLNGLEVDYYGSPTPIQQVGNVTVPEARIIMIQPWESKMIATCSGTSKSSPSISLCIIFSFK